MCKGKAVPCPFVSSDTMTFARNADEPEGFCAIPFRDGAFCAKSVAHTKGEPNDPD